MLQWYKRGAAYRIEGRAAYSIFKAVALTGRIAHCYYTQGVALG